jgi:bifunctional UDP-N-acetylglucosamine pyrophosphorylase/glucosamine-1-phosphate N-acetyltransferase
MKTLLPKVENKNAQSEYYLTDLIELAVSEGFEVEAEQADNLEEVQGVNDRLQLCELECWYQSVISEQLMLSGVTLYDPNRTDVRGTLKTGIDVTIDINTVFEGNVELGDGVTVGPNCVITNSVIGAHTEIKANSLIEETSIGEHAVIGPFARLRPGTQLADKTKVGNFVETKKAIVAKGSKINHLSYIGDAELGENVNVGAGTITCNYDGVNKSQTVLGDEVFIGSNSSLVAPVKVADGATVGAGSVITKNVEAGELAVARGKQANIKGWKKPSKKT